MTLTALIAAFALAGILCFIAAVRRLRRRRRCTISARGLPRTVYPLNPPHRLDLWELVHRHHSWLPWVDAIYRAVCLPMADAASYEIKVPQSALIARPLNQAARDALGNWR